jgi:ubiquinone/menaquinone biosynthesis C-methylase UbiE
MIRIAKEKTSQQQINNIDFSVGDIYNLPFEDKTFDTVLASNILHLLFRPERALHEIQRVLMDNGRIIAPTFCHGTHLRSKIFTFILSLLGQNPKNNWTPKGFTALIENSGFRITKEIFVNDNIPLVYIVAQKR